MADESNAILRLSLELSDVLDKIEELIAEAKTVQCPYVGIFELEELLAAHGRKVDDE